LHFLSIYNTYDKECSENQEGGEIDGPGNFEIGHGKAIFPSMR
jgi:hypothetical protein